MMKAKELRIGNWIMDRGGKEWQIDFWECRNKVSAKEPEFNTCGMTLIGHPMTEYIDYIKPIPLTEEWLFRFGFVHEYNEYFDRFVMHGFFVEFDNEDNCYYVGVESGGRNIAKINYVHRLQNLFFELGYKIELK